MAGRVAGGMQRERASRQLVVFCERLHAVNGGWQDSGHRSPRLRRATQSDRRDCRARCRHESRGEPGISSARPKAVASPTVNSVRVRPA